MGPAHALLATRFLPSHMGSRLAFLTRLVANVGGPTPVPPRSVNQFPPNPTPSLPLALCHAGGRGWSE